MKIARIATITFFAAFLAYAAYLAWRVGEERKVVAAEVAAIIAAMDPAVDRLSEDRIAILVRVEDPTFWTNDGIDLSTPGAGFTTLSQGLGKSVLFERFSPGLAKVELMVLTRFALIDVVSKRDILRAVLAAAYLGHDEQGPINGFAEGARRWFGKELNDLSRAEFIALVAMLPAPNALDPVRHADANAERVRRIERLLAGACEPEGLNDVYLDGCSAR